MIAEIIEFFKDTFKLIILIAIIVLIRIYVLSTTEVVGDSMLPTLKNGNIMLVNQLSARLDKYNRFDIIVFKFGSPSYLIKRIIALPGETIEYINNELYINGINEKFAFKVLGTTENFKVVLENDEYFVMGDNRGNSSDSRDFGPIKEDKIVGTPFFTILPVKAMGIKK
jgi:signal peptidase I